MAKNDNGKGGRNKNKKLAPIDPLAIAPLQTVLNNLGVKETSWDVVIVGDGSGSNWQNGCGWAAVLVDRETKNRRIFYGAMSCGSVNLSELMPYLQCLMWYEAVRKTWLKTKGKGLTRVHIITDSKLTADQGNNIVDRNANTEIWAAIEDIEQRGYHITWHWMERSSTGLNALTDCVSKSSRIALSNLKLPENSDVYHYNPSSDSV